MYGAVRTSTSFARSNLSGSLSCVARYGKKQAS